VRFARAYWLPVVRALAELDRRGKVAGHGDLNPSNVIFRDHPDPVAEIGGRTALARARGLVPAPPRGLWPLVRDRLRGFTQSGPPPPVDDPGSANAVFVDLGPSLLLGEV